MPIGDTGSNPGGDDSADKTVGKGDAADPKNADKSAKGKGDKGDDDEADTPKPVTFSSQAELDALIARRVNRATKDADDKAKLTKEQLLEKERDDLKQVLTERDLKDSFVEAAGIDAGKAGRLFRMFRDDIETDDKGKAVNMKAVLSTAKAEFPELFGKPKPGGKGDGGAGNGDDGKSVGGSMNDAIRKMAGR